MTETEKKPKGRAKRHQFKPEFKAEAVRLVLEQGKSTAQAARDLGLWESVMSRWVRQATRKAVQYMLDDGKPGRWAVQAER
jgi:transposase